MRQTWAEEADDERDDADRGVAGAEPDEAAGDAEEVHGGCARARCRPHTSSRRRSPPGGLVLVLHPPPSSRDPGGPGGRRSSRRRECRPRRSPGSPRRRNMLCYVMYFAYVQKL